MAFKIRRGNGGELVELHVRGRFTREDCRRMAPALSSLFQRAGRLRLLVFLHDLEGWDTDVPWEDLRLDIPHFGDIVRIALVGENEWQKDLSRLCEAFTPAEVRYFDRAESDEARAWVGRN